MAEKQPKKWTNDPVSVQRGDYRSSYVARTIFILGRLATGPIQYTILKSHPLRRFNVPAPPTGGFITVLGTQTPRLPFLTALMPTVLSAKHILWASTLSSEHMTIPFALAGVLMDICYESVCTLVFTTSAVNPLWSRRLFYAGTTIYYAGVALELLAELQRLAFKRKPENEDKLCTTGFWGVTRHVNYTANVLFGFGCGLCTGGPLYAPLTAGMYLANFTFNAIPGVEAYCRLKYGEAWQRYVEMVPYRLVPWVY